MTRVELEQFHQQMCDRCAAILQKKNHDYANETDPFANFTRIEALGVASAEVGIMTRMLDKFCRISTYLKNGKLAVESESVTDTLDDLVNYAIILAAYIAQKKQSNPAIQQIRDAMDQRLSLGDK